MHAARGGRHQRAARNAVRGQPASNMSSSKSELAFFLTLQSLWGFCSPQHAQKIAELARRDIRTAMNQGGDFSFKDLDMLATLGGSGSHPQNMHSDMLSKLERPHFQASVHNLPLKIHEKKSAPHSQHVLLPHETFATLYHHYPNQWKDRVLPQQDSLQRFWAEMSDHPLMVDHPIRERRNWHQLAVPLSLQGDGVPCVGVGKAWGKTMDLLSWTSCLVSGATMATFFYVYGVFKNCMSTNFGANTMFEFWTLMCWSLMALYLGEWPHKDAWGTAYAADTP